jgi:UPF0042 nucleotide-binding protein
MTCSFDGTKAAGAAIRCRTPNASWTGSPANARSWSHCAAIVDTSNLNVHQLRDRLHELFADHETAGALQVNVVSFGYKHGLPLDVDLVFDCRFLPNPHWVDELRPYTGLDAPVVEYVMAQPATGAFLAELGRLLELTLPGYEEEGKAYLSIGIGCTGGRHRSVVIAEQMAAHLRECGCRTAVHHRDIERN